MPDGYFAVSLRQDTVDIIRELSAHEKKAQTIIVHDAMLLYRSLRPIEAVR